MLHRIREQLSNFARHWFVRNTVLLQTGSFAGTLAQAVTGVLLARLLQPELFGIYTLAFSVAGLTSLFLGGGTQDAVSVIVGESYARQDRERLREGFAYLIKVSFFAVLLALAVAAWAPLLTDIFYGNRLIGWYAMIVIAAASISTLFFSVASLGFQVAGEIKSLTGLVMIDQMLRFGLSLLLAFLGGGVLGAVSGHLIGSIFIFILSLRLWSRLRQYNQIFPSLIELFREVRRVAFTKYLSFSFWITVDRNIATLYATLPVLLTGLFVSPSEVTFFKLALGYINVSLSLLGPISTLLNVEFPRMKVMGIHQLIRNFIRVSGYGLLLSSILTIAAMAISPVAFHILYGPNFRASVPYVFGLALYGALFGIGVGLGPMWRAVKRVDVSIIINLLTLGIGVPLGLLVIRNYGLWGSVAMVTAWYTVSHFASFLYLQHLLRRLPNR